MSPFQHGEVFVTEDGAETDLDLGHYERFTDVTTRASNATAGAIYDTVISFERRGDFLGGTVQVILHITDEIKQRIRLVAEAQDVDVVITEVGGTVGDIESLPFLEALRQFQVDEGRDCCLFVHLTLVPFLGHAGELKTKPTQHSVQGEPRRIGIQPTWSSAGARSRSAATSARRSPSSPTCRWSRSYPRARRGLHLQGPALLSRGGCGPGDPRPLRHRRRAARARRLARLRRAHDQATTPVRIGLVGKYTKLSDAYLSVIEALNHSGMHWAARPRVRWVDSEQFTGEEAGAGTPGLRRDPDPRRLRPRDRGQDPGKRYAREHGVPLGICLA